MKHKNFAYGEILFTGKCNFKCYYCLGNEMNELRATLDSSLTTHFSQWKKFDEWFNYLEQHAVDTVFLSSTTTEPLLYKYLSELVDYLQPRFKVGIRTNASLLTPSTLDTLARLNGEVSLSLQAITDKTHRAITSKPLRTPVSQILNKLVERSIKFRLSIVVNQYNYTEVPELIDLAVQFKDNISYFQLRRYYLHDSELLEIEEKAFDHVVEYVKTNGNLTGHYHESPEYNVNGLTISLWYTVFKKSSLHTSNYWTSGVITENNLLVPGYREETQ